MNTLCLIIKSIRYIDMDAGVIEKTFLRALEKREYLFNNDDTTAFRLFNSRGDDLEGITIDVYNEFVLVQVFNDYFLYNRDFLSIISKVLIRSPLQIKGLLLKNRSKIYHSKDIANLRKSVLVEGMLPPEDYSVKQNNVKIYVDLLKGQNTGIFLDMRLIRKKLVPYYKEFKNMLNLFSYTGIFSVHALKNGVMNSINVDISGASLRRAKKNYVLNGLNCDDRDFVQEDSFKCISKFKKQDKDFSLIIIDPPTFARNRKKYFSVKKDFNFYLKSLEKISSKGYVLTTVNSPAISIKDFMSYHPPNWENVFYDNEPDDFPWDKFPYLKVALWAIK